ncbi:MAG TPA: lysophospholipid acyltransferase family protein [Thermoanaerobaculia bacterium]|nr:lysophospholipid acyltransferase family protein [Thermoanaerobaculia bacterium]
MRLRYHGEARVRDWERQGRHFILAFWHRHLLLMPYGYRGRRISVLISQSRDGELIARTVARLGIDSSRGSSTRGGMAGLRALLRKAAEGYDLAFTPDGPKGPAEVVQPGVILAAAATGLPVQPVAMAASRCRRLRSWDRFVVPLPGARVHFVYGEPLTVPRRAAPEGAAEELGRRLCQCEAAALRLAAGDTGDIGDTGETGDAGEVQGGLAED